MSLPKFSTSSELVSLSTNGDAKFMTHWPRHAQFPCALFSFGQSGHAALESQKILPLFCDLPNEYDPFTRSLTTLGQVVNVPLRHDHVDKGDSQRRLGWSARRPEHGF